MPGRYSKEFAKVTGISIPPPRPDQLRRIKRITFLLIIYADWCFFFLFFFPQENGRSVPDLTASPGRAPPGPMPSHQQQQQAGQGMQQHHQGQGGHMQQGGGGQRGMGSSGANKEPVLLQGDFRKVSGISSEIFRQIEAVENDHDPSTAAALEVSCR